MVDSPKPANSPSPGEPGRELELSLDLRDEPRRVLPPPRFSLAALTGAITLIAVILAIMQWIGPVASLTMATLGLVMLAHLAASYVGRQLLVRRRSQRDDPPPGTAPHGASQAKPTRPRLAHSHPQHRWTIRLVVFLGFLGTASGAMGSTLVPPEEFNWAVVAVCAISGCALAAIFGFVLSNFFVQSWISWFEAQRSGPSRKSVPLRKTRG